MKLKISLRKDGHPQIMFKADITKPENTPTASLLFADMATSDMAKGFELVRWQIKRRHSKWKGLADEESPRFEDGDHVTLHARKAIEA